MSSTQTHASPVLDRKALKRPDELTNAIRGFFDALTKKTGVVAGALIAILAIGGAGAFLKVRQDSKNEAARNALFQAQKEFEGEYKAVAEAMAPAKAPEAKPEAKKGAQPEAPAMEDLSFKALDVDAKFPKTVAKFQVVTEQYSGTRAGFEAMLALGALYLEHGGSEKAATWFEKAVAQAPNSLEKAVAGFSLGQARENQGKHKEALEAYEKALALGQAPLKGPVMLGIARSHELLKDNAKARATYDQIVAQLPNTEASRQAESAKALLD